MTIRITLLVLVTGLFAMIWTHDQPAREASGPLTKSHRTGIVSMAQVDGAEAEPSISHWMRGHLAAVGQSLESEWLPRIDGQFDLAMGESSRFIASAGREWAANQFEKSSQDIRLWVRANINRSASPAQIAARETAFSDSEMPLPAGIVPGEYRAVSNTGAVRRLMLTLEDLPADSEFVTQDVYQSSGETSRWFFIRVQSNPNEIVPVIAERGSHIVVTEEERRNRQASQIIVKAGQQVAGGVLEALRSMRMPARMSSEEPKKTRL